MDHAGAAWHGSPNYGPRRDGLQPELIVIHHTAMHSADAALARLCDPEAAVSAHYLIGACGRITQMVAEQQRAWHAGAGSWAGRDDVNSRSIGIELDNRGTHPFSEPQMRALEALLQDVMTRWAIPAAGVIGHSDMAPGRKADPGPHFDWARLARCGLAVPAGQGDAAQDVDDDRFRAAARSAGFTAEVPDADLLRAVRLRFRPWARGPLASGDIQVLQGRTT